MSIVSFIIFPTMIGFLAISENFVLILLTEKWLPATIFIQIFCVVYMFNVIQTGNLQVIRAIGRSDIILKLEIIKKSLYFAVILLFVLFTNNPIYLGVACVINTFIATIVNVAPNKKLVGYTYSMQLSDLLWNFLTALAMGCIVFLMGFLNLNVYLLTVLQIVTGVITYVILSFITRNPNAKDLISIIKGFLMKRSAVDK